MTSTDSTPAPAVTDQPLLRVENLTVRYGLSTGLRDVSFDVQHGVALALLGVNGSGKSTLARALSGLVPVAEGKIIFDGQDITKWTANKVRKAGLIYLPEGRGIFPELTVAENLRLSAGVVKNRNDRRAAVDQAMEFFPVLRERAKTHAAMLSGGEQQMLSLAGALTTEPKIIVADEMSLGLAPKMVDAVYHAIETMKGTGATIILIEQFAQRALKFAEECALLQRGGLSWKGRSREASTEILASYLGEASSSGV